MATSSGPHKQVRGKGVNMKSAQGQNSKQASSESNDGPSNQHAPSGLLASGDSQRSIHDKFNVDTRTGGMSFGIPIYTSPGRSDFAPFLELVYNSGAASANGLFGMGWQLAGVDSIARKTAAMIPTFDDDADVFTHSSLGDLVPVVEDDKPLEREASKDGKTYDVMFYRPRVESSPVRIERWKARDSSQTLHWKVISSANVTSLFGDENNSRVFEIGLSSGSGKERCFRWLISEVRDSQGNQMVYQYAIDDGADLKTVLADKIYEADRTSATYSTQRYLHTIKYGNLEPNCDPRADSTTWMFEVVFDYQHDEAAAPLAVVPPEVNKWTVRPDPFSVYNSGFEIRTYRRCERVLMFHRFDELGRDYSLVASTVFNYTTDQNSGASFLHSYVPWHYSPIDDENYWSMSLGGTAFKYSEVPELDNAVVERHELALAGLSSSDAEWVDLNGDGAPGVLYKALGGAGWYYHPNQSSQQLELGGPALVPLMPSMLESVADWSLKDVTADGQLNVVFPPFSSTNICGFYERADDGDWTTFTPFESCPSLSSSVETLNIDLTGDGRSDILELQSQDDSSELAWFPSLGKGGYGYQRRTAGAPQVPAGDLRLVTLCDMQGDGLADIVAVFHSHVCYWPNMGHGRFGKKITMGNPPFLDDISTFNPLRVRMADITGSGAADMIYLPPSGGLHVWYNRQGNEWSDRIVSDGFPALDQSCAVDVFDIAGRGTQCLCWTSDWPAHSGSASGTTLKFIDLMGGMRPGLMTACSDSLGSVVEIDYRSSVQYHNDDQRNGTPWTTKLPFSIDCVRSMVSRDLIAQSTRTVRYAYHNGHYDYAESQFRGFQMVEEQREENLAAGPNNEKRFSQPTVTSKTWFYIGLETIDQESTLPGSYSSVQPEQVPLPTSVISGSSPIHLSSEDVREAYGALAGRQRRQEVFSHESSPRAAVPYTVQEQSYQVMLDQRAGSGHKYAISRVNDCEEINIEYDRNTAEAKVQHSLALDTDKYGNVLRRAVVYYGRADASGQNGATPSMSLEDQEKQQETIITYSESDFTNAIDQFQSHGPPSTNTANDTSSSYFQSPMPSESREYRVYPGSSWRSNSRHRYAWKDLGANGCALLSNAVDIAADEVENRDDPASDQGYKALIAKKRILYSRSDLTGPLPLRQLEPHSIQHQTLELALNKKLLGTALASQGKPLLEDDEIVQELRNGGYLYIDEEWWVPSTQRLFVARDKASSSQLLDNNSLEIARSLFYIPNAEIDQHGNVFYQDADKYKLLPKKITNACGATTSFLNDYIHVQARMVTDANGNRTETVFDPSGRVIGVASMGKEGEIVGDSLEGFVQRIEPEQLRRFMDDPSGDISKELLGKASKREIYNDTYKEDGDHLIPAFRAELTRHSHHAADQNPTPPTIGIQITYLDGHGRPIQQVSLSGNPEHDRKWVTSSHTLHGQNDQVARQFFPTAAPTHHFRRQSSLLATTFLRDPLNRVVGVLNVDHTWSKIRFSPWSEVSFTASDTVALQPSQDVDIGHYLSLLDESAYLPTWYDRMMNSSGDEETVKACKLSATRSAAYGERPAFVDLDALGRELVRTLDNGDAVKRQTRIKYDAMGNVAVLRDAADRIVTQTNYGFMGRPLRSVNMDTGHGWYLPDCNGSPWLSWSGNLIRRRTEYDVLRREKRIKLLLPSRPDHEEISIEYVYGDENEQLGDGVNAAGDNLIGKLYQRRDQSGTETSNRFDFKGNRLESTIRYATEYKQRLDWSGVGDQITFDEAVYRTKVSYDALNHPVQVTALNGEILVSTISRTYDVAGRLTSLEASQGGDSEPTSIQEVQYTDDDSISQIRYGNGVFSTREYDSETRKVKRISTVRQSPSSSLSGTVQDLAYVHDCVGRILQKNNATGQDIIARSVSSSSSPLQDFTYDPLGQLVKAIGREQVNPSQKHLTADEASSGPRPSASSLVIGYEEIYEYDATGNLWKIQHVPQNSEYQGWTRTYTYSGRSCTQPTQGVYGNRLTSTESQGKTSEYKYVENIGTEDEYDTSGCISSMPGFQLNWDHNDKLRSFTRQKTANESSTPETTFYVYNAQGQRTRKVTERATSANGSSKATILKEHRFLPTYDIFTVFDGQGVPNRQTTTTNAVDLAFSEAPVLMIESNTSEGSEASLPLVRYRVGENLELDPSSQVISYDEYSPYGSRTYQLIHSDAPRKYRFAGYERDSESGFYFCGARYYAPWLGRWISADPEGTSDGLNMYSYVGNDPVNYEDHRGTTKKKKGEQAGSSGAANENKVHVQHQAYQVKPRQYSDRLKHEGTNPYPLHGWASIVKFKEPIDDAELSSLVETTYKAMAREADGAKGEPVYTPEEMRLSDKVHSVAYTLNIKPAKGKQIEERSVIPAFKPSAKPSVMAAYSPDSKTVIFASSITKFDVADYAKRNGRNTSPKEYNTDSTINPRMTEILTAQAHHKTHACGEIMNLNLFFNSTAEPRTATGVSVAFGKAAKQGEPALLGPCPGCGTLLSGLGIRAIMPPNENQP